MNEFVFALVGNPNSGKTTLFNRLTGSSAAVGNRSGVTVEARAGICRFKSQGRGIKIIDLPGIYSLSPVSAEEDITRRYILEKKPDVIINIVDITNPERNLYLTTQLADLEIPMITALNMTDALKKSGRTLDAAKLEKSLGICAVPISAGKGTGIFRLVQKAAEIKTPAKPAVTYDTDTERSVRSLMQKRSVGRFEALELLEKEGASCEEYFAQSRYEFINKTVKDCIRSVIEDRRAVITDKIDAVVTHPLFTVPLFLAVMLTVFQITFGSFGKMLSSMVDSLFNVHLAGAVSELLLRIHTPPFLYSLATDGIIAGIGGAAAFFPQIMLLFIFMSFLEDSGYMARTSFIMDSVLTKIGLSGKAFVPMIMGFGCSVPAMMAVRTLEGRRDRILALLLIPFMSCGAKMPIYSVFASAFFPHHTGLVIFSLYLLGIVLGLISGLIFSKTVLKGDSAPFILELPPYRLPSLKNAARHVSDKARDFLNRAITVLLPASVIIWLMQNLDIHLMFVPSGTDSILGVIGKITAPLLAPCGFGNYRATVSLLSGIAAKEALVSSMSILYGAANSAELSSSLAKTFTPLSAYSFLVFVLLYTPCAAAVSTLAAELNSRKFTVFSICWQMAAAWTVSALIFQIGSIFSGISAFF